MGSDDIQGYCNYCKRSFSVASHGISQVRRHASGKVHLWFENAANRQTGLIGSFLLPSSISSSTSIMESTSITRPTSNSRTENPSSNSESESSSSIPNSRYGFCSWVWCIFSSICPNLCTATTKIKRWWVKGRNYVGFQIGFQSVILQFLWQTHWTSLSFSRFRLSEKLQGEPVQSCLRNQSWFRAIFPATNK